MAERSKALDSSSSEGNLAWVQIPLRAILFLVLLIAMDCVCMSFVCSCGQCYELLPHRGYKMREVVCSVQLPKQLP